MKTTLHILVCPHCGQSAIVNTPLLILRPSKKPALLFSPAGGSGSSQDQEQAEALIGMCRAHLGDTWQDSWLADGVLIVARADLPTAIPYESGSSPIDDVDPRLRSTLERIVAMITAEGLRITTPEELQRAIEARPELKAELAEALNNT